MKYILILLVFVFNFTTCEAALCGRHFARSAARGMRALTTLTLTTHSPTTGNEETTTHTFPTGSGLERATLMWWPGIESYFRRKEVSRNRVASGAVFLGSGVISGLSGFELYLGSESHSMILALSLCMTSYLGYCLASYSRYLSSLEAPEDCTVQGYIEFCRRKGEDPFPGVDPEDIEALKGILDSQQKSRGGLAGATLHYDREG